MGNTVISIVIPTYNESENIRELVERIHQSMRDYDYEIVIVDDDSPDETWKIAQELSKTYPIKVIRRLNERGLASAVLEGFNQAKGDIIVVMDADLQHPPEIIPLLVDPLIKGEASVSIASRYIEGGGIENWSFSRKIISWGARFLSYMALPELRGIKDTLSGYFAFKKEIIEGVELKPIGYKILLEVLIRTGEKNVVEIPYTFKSREKGKSKLGTKQILNYIKHLWRLSMWTGDLWRVFKYTLVGITGILVNLSILYLLVETGAIKTILQKLNILIDGNFTKLVAAAISVEISIIWNYIINNTWTYKSRKQSGLEMLKGAIKFNAASIIGYLINLATFWILLTYTNIYYITAELIAVSYTHLTLPTTERV